MLRISKLTDYGTMVLACLAARPGQRCTAAALAERTRLGLPTVSKLLKSFHRAGLVTSVRGAHGGYQLALRRGLAHGAAFPRVAFPGNGKELCLRLRVPCVWRRCWHSACPAFSPSGARGRSVDARSIPPG